MGQSVIEDLKVRSTPKGLPDGWFVAKLGDLCDTTSGGTPARKIEAYFKGNIPWVKSGELPDGPVIDIEEFITNEAITNSSAKLFPSGTLLIALYGATVGKLGILTRQAATNQAVCAIFPRTDLKTKYLFWYLQLARPELVRKAIGGAQPNISQGILRTLEIPVASLREQAKIVAEIEKQFSRLDEAVTSLKRTKANLKRYKAAVLKAAVEGKLTEEWREQHPNVEPASKLLERILAERRAKWNGRGKYKEPAAPDAGDLPTLPRNWTWARLEQLGIIVGGLTKNPKRGRFTKKLPYLRVANVYADELRLDEIEYIGVQDSELEKLVLKKGDLLIVEGNGSKDQIGRLAIWDGSISPCVHQNHLIKVRLVTASTNKWILFWLLSPIGRHFIEKVSSSTSGLYTLSVNKVGDLPVIVPPFAELEQIVAEVERRLSVIDELETAVEANLTRIDRLRQSILSRAFSGQLFQYETKNISDAVTAFSLAAEGQARYGKVSQEER